MFNNQQTFGGMFWQSEKHQHQFDEKPIKYLVCNYLSCFQLLVARARRWGSVTLEYGVDSWDGPNSGTEHSGITILHGHQRPYGRRGCEDVMLLLGRVGGPTVCIDLWSRSDKPTHTTKNKTNLNLNLNLNQQKDLNLFRRKVGGNKIEGYFTYLRVKIEWRKGTNRFPSMNRAVTKSILQMRSTIDTILHV